MLLNGILKDSTFKDLNLKFEDVELADIIPKQDSITFEGTVDGSLDIYQKDNIYSPNLNLVIDKFKFNSIPYGQFLLKANGNKRLKFF